MVQGRRAGLAVAVATPLLGLLMVAPWSAPAASARSCDDLTAVATAAADRTEVLVTLPAALTGQTVPATAVSVTQNGVDVPVRSLQPVVDSLADVALVVDTSAQAAPLAEPVRAAASALLTGLPADTSRAVVTTGVPVAVVQEPTAANGTAATQVADLPNRGSSAIVDAVLAAVRLLPADPSRQQHLVVVAAGQDQSSAADWGVASALLERRRVVMDVIDLATDAPSLPAAGVQCPGAIAPETAAAAGAALAGQIADGRRMVLAPLSGTAPATVTVSLAGVTAGTVLQRRAAAPAPKPNTEPAQRTDQVGAGTLIMALVVGLAGLAAVLAVTMALSPRGRQARAAARELLRIAGTRRREWRVPDDARTMPVAEVGRRSRDAWQDLVAAMTGSEPTARTLAEAAAWEQHHAMAEAAERRAVARERATAQERAVQRRERTRRRAELVAAEERALRESAALHGAPMPLLTGRYAAEQLAAEQADDPRRGSAPLQATAATTDAEDARPAEEAPVTDDPIALGGGRAASTRKSSGGRTRQQASGDKTPPVRRSARKKTTPKSSDEAARAEEQRQVLAVIRAAPVIDLRARELDEADGQSEEQGASGRPRRNRPGGERPAG
jgi:hypothetical protein